MGEGRFFRKEPTTYSNLRLLFEGTEISKVSEEETKLHKGKVGKKEVRFGEKLELKALKIGMRLTSA